MGVEKDTSMGVVDKDMVVGLKNQIWKVVMVTTVVMEGMGDMVKSKEMMKNNNRQLELELPLLILVEIYLNLLELLSFLW